MIIGAERPRRLCVGASAAVVDQTEPVLSFVKLLRIRQFATVPSGGSWTPHIGYSARSGPLSVLHFGKARQDPTCMTYLLEPV